MQVLLANPRGFCAGVDRAIDIVERAVELFGPPIYVRHEVVHNRHVVERLRSLGAVFVDELHEVPAGGTVIFSAHGVSNAVEEEAKSRALTVFNATCPLVTKVHMEVQRYAREGRDVILIGHAGHPEVEGTMGRFDASFGGRIHLVESIADVVSLGVRDPDSVAFVTQTTLSVDDTAGVVAALRVRFPARDSSARGHLLCHSEPAGRGEEVTRAVRCSAGRRFPHQLQFQPVAGACRSRRRAGLPGRRATMICARSGSRVSAPRGHRGRLAPELLVQQVVDRLRSWGGAPHEALGREERVFFTLPRELRRAGKDEPDGVPPQG